MRYLRYFGRTFSFGSSVVVGTDLSANVWAKVYDAATLVWLFFQCAVIGIIVVLLSSSKMCLSSLSETFAITCPICLVFFGDCCFLGRLHLGISILFVIVFKCLGIFIKWFFILSSQLLGCVVIAMLVQ